MSLATRDHTVLPATRHQVNTHMVDFLRFAVA